MTCWRVFGFVLGLLSSGTAFAADRPSTTIIGCVAEAALHHRVSPELLMAVAWQESRLNPMAVNINRNSTVDLGIMQINSVHWRELARYGIRPVDLLDPCISIFVGAWLLRRNIDRYGANWQAIGAYHSATPALRDAYAKQVAKFLR